MSQRMLQNIMIMWVGQMVFVYGKTGNVLCKCILFLQCSRASLGKVSNVLMFGKSEGMEGGTS